MQALEKAFSLRKLLKGVFQQNKLVTQERRQYDNNKEGAEGILRMVAKGGPAETNPDSTHSRLDRGLREEISRREQNRIDIFI